MVLYTHNAVNKQARHRGLTCHPDTPLYSYGLPSYCLLIHTVMRNTLVPKIDPGVPNDKWTFSQPVRPSPKADRPEAAYVVRTWLWMNEWMNDNCILSRGTLRLCIEISTSQYDFGNIFVKNGNGKKSQLPTSHYHEREKELTKCMEEEVAIFHIHVSISQKAYTHPHAWLICDRL